MYLSSGRGRKSGGARATGATPSLAPLVIEYCFPDLGQVRESIKSGFSPWFLGFCYKSNQNSGWVEFRYHFSGSGWVRVSQSQVFPPRVFGYPTTSL